MNVMQALSVSFPVTGETICLEGLHGLNQNFFLKFVPRQTNCFKGVEWNQAEVSRTHIKLAALAK
jgi:hypothetical protein